jgi:hypothetical protein
VYHTTGSTRAQIEELCNVIRADAQPSPERAWPPILGLFTAIVVTLTYLPYLRRNRVQVELAETHGVSQGTISQAPPRPPVPMLHQGGLVIGMWRDRCWQIWAIND